MFLGFIIKQHHSWFDFSHKIAKNQKLDTFIDKNGTTLSVCRFFLHVPRIILSDILMLVALGECYKSLKTSENRCSKLILKSIAMMFFFFAVEKFFCCVTRIFAIHIRGVLAARVWTRARRGTGYRLLTHFRVCKKGILGDPPYGNLRDRSHLRRQRRRRKIVSVWI